MTTLWPLALLQNLVIYYLERFIQRPLVIYNLRLVENLFGYHNIRKIDYAGPGNTLIRLWKIRYMIYKQIRLYLRPD